MSEGWIYVLINPTMQKNLPKIGKTTKSPEERAKELSSSSGMPMEYYVAYDVYVSDCSMAEKLIHKKLERYRFKRNREFFHLPLRQVIPVMEEIAHHVGKISEESALESHEPREEKVVNKKTHPNDSSKVRPSYANFEELRSHLEEAIADRITICMDKHLLTGGTLVELQRKIEEDNKRLRSNDFRSPSRIKSHINFRRKHNKWAIKENSIGEFRIVGYRQDIDENLRSTHMKRGKEFTLEK